MSDRPDALRAERASLIAYAQTKLAAEDWRALADAAMDLRDVDAELKGLALTVEPAASLDPNLLAWTLTELLLQRRSPALLSALRAAVK